LEKILALAMQPFYADATSQPDYGLRVPVAVAVIVSVAVAIGVRVGDGPGVTVGVGVGGIGRNVNCHEAMIV